MSFAIDIEKQVGDARRQFRLRASFQATARRVVVHGPSGSGKTLTLQALAGLIRPDRGRIVFDGQVLFDSAARIDLPARERRFGYLFQHYALFPHLTVRQNIAFGLSRGLLPPGDALSRSEPVERWLDAMELRPVAAQHPFELSGGQRQRTALARALVNEPRALLLDEPFSALDPDLRERMRGELDQLLRQIDIPAVMITHDRDDLRRFGEQTFAMREGGVVALGPDADPQRTDTVVHSSSSMRSVGRQT